MERRRTVVPENPGKDLALSEPFMQFGNVLATIGQQVETGDVPQTVLDAFDYVKSHLQSGGKQLQDAYQTLKNHLSDMTTAHAQEATPAPPVKRTQVGPYQVEHVGMTDAPVKAPAAKPAASDPSQWPVVSKDDPSTWPVVGGAAPDEQPKAPGSGLGTMATALQGVKDFGIGAVKGAAHTAIDLGSAVHMIPGVSTAVDKLYGTPGLSQAAFPAAREATAYSNPTQQLGGAAETVAEMAVPVDAGVQALPSAARAGAKFTEVMGAAKGIPINEIPVAQQAMRIKEFASHGSTMPKAVNDFLRYVSNPSQPQMTYETARDFLTNMGRLSVSERMAMNPPMQREVAVMTANLAKSVADAANAAGKGQVYAKAMTEYARAKQLEGVYDAFLKGAQKSALPAAVAGGAAGAGYWLTSRLKSILGD
jgi:hypothetical protein